MWQWLIAILGSSMGAGTFISIAFIVLLVLAFLGGSSDAGLLLAIIALIFIIPIAGLYLKRSFEKSYNEEKLLGEKYKKKYEEAKKRNIKNLIIWGIITFILVTGILILSRVGTSTNNVSNASNKGEDIVVADSIRQAYRREQDSIEKAKKEAHEERVRQLARDIVNSGKNDRKRSNNMRGWDPASEDDSDENGMDRYMENDDEKGWD